MKKFKGEWFISPRDLIAELECTQRLHLEWAVLEKHLPAPDSENGPELELLIEQGRLHEKALATQLRAAGSFVDIGEPKFTQEALTLAHEKTVEAVHNGIETIYQATFFTKGFMGFADFLILVKDETGKPLKDAEGRFVYDPVDAKSA